MTKGLIGTRNLNKVLQQLINPPAEDKAELVRGDSILRVSDRVMQLKNDYSREVFNGDLGIVRAIDKTEKEITIDFDEATPAHGSTFCSPSTTKGCPPQV
ncbi:hypothetical protein [Pleurocapsa sp. FMAR1]|uniref:hypothetical protein n=1 Tax=Pleurocapsa sp. FMAR1 TaxID=3040204 RepID=UPI0029C9368F|nr:hypothetical protein [Pleurocapsa sp. FMAR1]